MSNELNFCPDAAGTARLEEAWMQGLPGLETPAPSPCGTDLPAAPCQAFQTGSPCLDTPTPEVPAVDEAAFLQARLDRCCADARLYDVLAQRCSGAVARLCAQLACVKRSQAKRLQTALYIQTGQTYQPGPVCPYVYSAMEILRQQCLEESRSSQAYLDFADETANPRISALCTDLAAEDARCACLLEQLIAGMLGSNACSVC